jgi:glycosyltransferase involved in cell wall biosynthesis
MTAARVALLADTFYEVNGAARTCREWEAWARRHQLPLLCVRWGPTPGLRHEGTVSTLEISRSRFAFRVDPDLRFDPLLHRVVSTIQAEVERFQPDFIHITSPGDLGIIGATLAARLNIPLALSWHTNLHEFVSRRICQMAGRLGERVARFAERFALDRLCWFFGRGSVLFAPNPELVSMLRERTRKPVFPMGRGIDTALFSPERRHRHDDTLVLGYVGRLMPEKNLRLLPRVAAALHAHGISDFRFQITGAGSERQWLQENLPQAEFTGVLKGQLLATAYANLDIFLFPSCTDTFGNVVQEALASGAPAVVRNTGGPRFIVREGVTGLIAADDETFCEYTVLLALDAQLRRNMSLAARRQVENQTWDLVFSEVYDGYAQFRQTRGHVADRTSLDPIAAPGAKSPAC